MVRLLSCTGGFLGKRCNRCLISTKKGRWALQSHRKEGKSIQIMRMRTGESNTENIGHKGKGRQARRGLVFL